MERDARRTFSAKVVTLGAHAVGKTALVNCRFTGALAPNYRTLQATVSADYCRIPIVGRKWRVQMTVWDTAGQERFRATLPMYMRNAQIVLFVYDASDRASFESLERYRRDAEGEAPGAVCVLVATKTDFADRKREVRASEGKAWAARHEMLFFETSVALGRNVAEVFQAAAEALVDRISHRERDTAAYQHARASELLASGRYSDGDIVIIESVRREQQRRDCTCSI